jgi:hypothetical protein
VRTSFFVKARTSFFVKARHSPRKKGALVIPNSRCLRVRDLLFARKSRKKADSSARSSKTERVRNDTF